MGEFAALFSFNKNLSSLLVWSACEQLERTLEMRPVSRGVSPSEKFSHYRDAARSLIDRLGSYCSYCERHIETHLAVEHVSPKSVDPDREKDWENFLLGCVNCNSSKGDISINALNYFWPDIENTLEFFYYIDSLVVAAPGLNFEQQQKADALIYLIGLDKYPGNPDKRRRPSDSDRRWFFRKEILDVAQRARERLYKKDSAELREQVVETALGRGGFGIWFTVFAGDEDMRQRLVNAFPGTAKYYFSEFKDLTVPVHVLRVLTVIAEEVICSSKKYIVKVTVPEPSSYQRVKTELISSEQAKTAEVNQEFKSSSSFSVYISMIEYAPIPTISRNRITVIIFERRQVDGSVITKTRHYVQPSYEGSKVTAITFRAMTSVAKDVNNFFLTGIPPTISGQ